MAQKSKQSTPKKKNKPTKTKKDKPSDQLFSLADWLPRTEALNRWAAMLDSPVLAEHELRKRMRSGRLRSAVRCIRSDGRETFQLLEPSCWETPIGALPEGGHLRKFFDAFGKLADKWTEYFYFVDRRQFDKLSSAFAVRADNDTSRPRRTPGTKPTGDWHTVLAAWLILVACEQPQRILNANLDELAVEAEDFLRKKIGWAPSELGPIRTKIHQLLHFVLGR